MMVSKTVSMVLQAALFIVLLLAEATVVVHGFSITRSLSRCRLRQQQPLTPSPNTIDDARQSSALGYSTPQTVVEEGVLSITTQPQISRQVHVPSHDDDSRHPSSIQPPLPSLGDTEDGRSTMIPLATDPLLFVSSQPILTENECKCLMEWCVAVEGHSSLKEALQAEDAHGRKNEPVSEGATLFWRVQRWVHHELLGNHKNSTDYVVPRFVFYEEPDDDETIELGKGMEATTLLPDGLHVDTNGNQQFRHW
jgi:hypothetical protein